MNVESLDDDDLRWADLVFVSAMSVQKESVKEVIERCKTAGVRIVAGGPLFTTEYEKFEDVDHLVPSDYSRKAVSKRHQQFEGAIELGIEVWDEARLLALFAEQAP